MSGPVAVGAAAPSFTLPDQRLQPVSLDDYRGRALLVVFYPLTFTSVCGGELTRLRDEIGDFAGPDRAVVAISTDSSAVHRAYDDREFLGYPLLSDFWPHGQVASAYGVLDETNGFARRGTFLVDAEGVVRWSVVNDVPEARSNDDYRSALADVLGGPARVG